MHAGFGIQGLGLWVSDVASGVESRVQGGVGLMLLRSILMSLARRPRGADPHRKIAPISHPGRECSLLTAFGSALDRQGHEGSMMKILSPPIPLQ